VTITIRGYRPTDQEDLYEVCNRTADAGEDARPRIGDPLLMPILFAGPYAALEPELAYVLDDGGSTAGYLVATADTVQFARRFRAEWLPGLAGRYPPLGRPARTPAEELVGLLHDPQRMVLPALDRYPAHFHIDLLPDYRGRGYGRALVGRLTADLRTAGVTGVHVGMVTANTAARQFYDRVGFHVIPVPDPGPLTYLGTRLQPGTTNPEVR
jgi:GNAT superfamily N-acetyltransferase